MFFDTSWDFKIVSLPLNGYPLPPSAHTDKTPCHQYTDHVTNKHGFAHAGSEND